jgi:hypothetical protein
VDIVVVRGRLVVLATIVDEIDVLVVAAVVVVVVAVGVPVTTADITALQSTDWYLGRVLWSIRPSRGKR